ncbi:hypothetical protein ACTXOR_02875 [Arthrobacter rhombi]|uniref:Uncharacterized protein n=1 Tax=Arthrobacter rhombi TaxID=71253 RepID=A0A1R4GVB8_9MICC|nr:MULTISPECIES: hypothetical protein [Micrococcaceae]PCC25953.1 hypothetical protein CIK75_05670 [Glutamicibacter sp. BW78]SJM72128.1 hypothetical protein FM101_14420 [Arthrobacter rhombi]
MATEFDNQLIESVAVRRNRVTDALLYGENPTERRWKATTKQFLFSLVAAALITAICIGVSFVSNMLATRAAEKKQRQDQMQSSAILFLAPNQSAWPSPSPSPGRMGN